MSILQCPLCSVRPETATGYPRSAPASTLRPSIRQPALCIAATVTSPSSVTSPSYKKMEDEEQFPSIAVLFSKGFPKYVRGHIDECQGYYYYISTVLLAHVCLLINAEKTSSKISLCQLCHRERGG